MIKGFSPSPDGSARVLAVASRTTSPTPLALGPRAGVSGPPCVGVFSTLQVGLRICVAELTASASAS